jgi:ATP-dependent DNA ligase
MAPTSFPIAPPIEPMLAKLATELPGGDGLLYEPKWDGFRAIVFRGGGEVFIQSRDLRPLDRYFPELHAALLKGLPDNCVIDGEIVIATSASPGRFARREACAGDAIGLRRL